MTLEKPKLTNSVGGWCHLLNRRQSTEVVNLGFPNVIIKFQILLKEIFFNNRSYLF